jgi:hypothetical protein
MENSVDTKSRLRPWAFELSSTVGSLAAFAGMCIILVKFDRQPIFDGNLVKLNAIVSLISTVGRACLLAAIASCVSQWNWLLFASPRPRRLYDFDRVAEASRGPLGSFKLLFNRKVRGG